MAAIDQITATDGRFELIARLRAAHPADPGVLLALMMNHVVLAAGEAIWMPAGNVHAYLRGNGVELMGPSDNVLRGGLTHKHIDIAELTRVLDFSTGPAPSLMPAPLGANARAYRPEATPGGTVPFELLAVEGDAVLDLPGASIALVIDGAFVLESADASAPLDRGGALFVSRSTRIHATGTGRMFVATGVDA
jgi:mannose-6-phosphate isomerase